MHASPTLARLAALLMVASFAGAGCSRPIAPRATTPPAVAPARAGTVEPVEAGPGDTGPTCSSFRMRIPPDLEGVLAGGQPVRVRFAVEADGTVSRFAVLTSGVPDRLVSALRSGVEGCAWQPGRNGAGEPVTMWMEMPLSFFP